MLSTERGHAALLCEDVRDVKTVGRGSAGNILSSNILKFS